jgi:hypothetical protein
MISFKIINIFKFKKKKIFNLIKNKIKLINKIFNNNYNCKIKSN